MTPTPLHSSLRVSARLFTCADVFVVFFATWTLIQQGSFFAGLSFRESWLLGWPVSLIAAALVLRHEAPGLPGGPITSDQRPGALEEASVGLAVVVAIGLTLCLYRADSDDEVYLGLAARALDAPSAPMLSLQSPLIGGYLLTSYDFLRGAFSWLTGMPLLVSYYLVWPALVAVVMMAFQCRLLKLLKVEGVALALLALFVVIMGWGDEHRTPANFAFVRLFQGKGGLVWVTIPAALYYWLRFVEDSERRSLLLLVCSIVTGVGFSPTGVPSGAFAVGLFLSATLIHTRARPEQWRSLAGIACAVIYPLVTGFAMMYYFGHSTYYLGNSGAAVHTARGTVDSVTNLEQIQFVLGTGVRGIAALSCALALPFILRSSRARGPLSIYLCICSGLLLFPRSSEILGKLGYGTFGWRWMFAIPFVLALTVAADRVAYHFRTSWMRCAAVGIMAFAFLAPSTHWIVSEWNMTRLAFPGFKVPETRVMILQTYSMTARIEGMWLISPVSGRRL